MKIFMTMLGLYLLACAAPCPVFGQTGNTGPASSPELTTSFGCPYRVHPAGYVILLGRSYKIDAAGRIEWLSDCRRLEERIPILKESKGCGWSVDMETGRAHPLTKWVFRRPAVVIAARTVEAEEDVTVSDCAEDDQVNELAVKFTSDGCGGQNDFDRQFTTGEARALIDNEQVLSCLPALNLQWQHHTESCPAPSDAQRYNLPFEQVRIDGGPGIIKLCQPAPNPAVSSQPCPGVYAHDKWSKSSYGTKRWFVVTENGEKKEILSCLQDVDVVYPHQSRLIGWRHDDTHLVSIATSEWFVMLPEGPMVFDREELPDPVPYILEDETFEAGKQVQIGCEVWQIRRLKRRYQRPDLSQVELDGGPAPAVMLSACQ